MPLSDEDIRELKSELKKVSDEGRETRDAVRDVTKDVAEMIKDNHKILNQITKGDYAVFAKLDSRVEAVEKVADEIKELILELRKPKIHQWSWLIGLGFMMLSGGCSFVWWVNTTNVESVRKSVENFSELVVPRKEHERAWESYDKQLLEIRNSLRELRERVTVISNRKS